VPFTTTAGIAAHYAELYRGTADHEDEDEVRR
jgi:hypothetical protein